LNAPPGLLTNPCCGSHGVTVGKPLMLEGPIDLSGMTCNNGCDDVGEPVRLVALEAFRCSDGAQCGRTITFFFTLSIFFLFPEPRRTMETGSTDL
jgi:hypothetical protein